MASPKPVPSKAALNALRGLVFTTSCSVVLLAEERRRRSKLARAAIDNARKLHTVKARRRPVAMVESCLSDADVELLNLHRVSGAPTRKKRMRKITEPTPTTEEGAHSKRETLNEVSMNTGVLVSSMLAQSSNRPPRLHSPAKAMQDSIDHLESQLAQINMKISAVSGRDHGQDFHRRAALRSSLRPSEVTVWTRQWALEDGKSSTTSRPLESIEGTDKQNVDALTAEAVEYLQVSSRSDSHGNPQNQHPTLLLQRLLDAVDSPATRNDLALTFEHLILEVFKNLSVQKTSTTGSTVARKLRFYCLKFLKVLAQKQSTGLEDAINAVAPFYSSAPQLVVPLLHELMEHDSRDGTRCALESLSESSLAFDIDYQSIPELLDHHLQRYKDPAITCRFYNALQHPDLSSIVHIDPNTHYEMHRKLLEEACSSGDGPLCVEQIQKLGLIDRGRASRCESVEVSALLLDVRAGRLTSIHDVLERVEQACEGRLVSASLLAALTDICSKHFSAPELEILVRECIEKYGMKLSHTWVHLIAEYHADHLDQDSMLCWLQFCVERGYRAAAASMESLHRRFIHQWQVSDEEMAYMCQNLRDGKSTTPWRESWETRFIRHAERLRTVPETADQKDFSDMKLKALQDDWSSVWTTHAARLSSKASFSLRCLHLAVLARLKLDDGATEAARKLIAEADSQGQDVSQVLTPLLMAQMEEGRNPDILIRDALQQGFKVHDMVFNKAASMVAGSGDRKASIELCKTAALQNGNGDLLYNPYNFANLLYAYTGLGSYDPLASLLSRFAEEKRWWAGTKVTLQSLKLAMKAVAKRAVTSRSRREAQRHENMLRRLTDAHQHGFACKQTPTENLSLIDSLADICKSSRDQSPRGGHQRGSKKFDKSQKGTGARAPSKSRSWVYNRPSVSFMTVKTKDVPQTKVAHVERAYQQSHMPSELPGAAMAS